MKEGLPTIHGILKSHEGRSGEVTSGFDISSEGDRNIETPEEITEREEQEKIHGPHIDIDFKKLYEIKHRLEEELGIQIREDGKQRLSPERDEELENKLNNLTEEESKQLYVEVLSRIQEETNYFHELEEMGVLSNVLEHDLNDRFGLRKIGGIRVKWNSSVPQNLGHYSGLLGMAFVRGPKPSKEQILKSLFSKGVLPKDLLILFHEIAHSYQFPTSFIETYHLMAQEGSLKKGEELGEVHANRVASDPTFSNTKRRLIEDKILYKKDRKGKLLYPGVDIDKLIYAVEVIDQLNALGFTPQEIGKIIQEELIPSKEGYARIVILKKMQELDIDEQDLENLVQADKVERQIARLRAMQIIQEELDKLNKIN